MDFELKRALFNHLEASHPEYRKLFNEVETKLKAMSDGDQDLFQELMAPIELTTRIAAETAYKLGIIDRSKMKISVSQQDLDVWAAVQGIREQNEEDEQVLDFVNQLKLYEPDSPVLNMIREEHRKFKSKLRDAAH